jgi:hypothetical protein
MLSAGTAGHGLPSGQIWALYFEPLWAILAASETLVVDAKKAVNIVLKTNVRVALFRPVNINSPRFADGYLPYDTLLNANLSINTITSYRGLLSQVRP